MVRSREELMSAIKARIGDDTSDEALALIEDMTDTLTDYEGRIGEDWKTKYEQLDADWRKRYRDRFYEGGNAPEPVADPEPEPETKTIEELFTIKED